MGLATYVQADAKKCIVDNQYFIICDSLGKVSCINELCALGRKILAKCEKVSYYEKGQKEE